MSKRIQKKPFFQNNYLRTLLIVVILAIGVGGWQLYSNYSNNKLSFVSFSPSKYHFTIKFPGKPTATNQNENILGSNITGSEYTATVVKGQQQFTVWVLQIPDQSKISKLSQSKILVLVKFDVDAVANIALKGTIDNTNTSTYLGYATDQVDFKSSYNGYNQTGYMRGFYTNQNQFLIFTLGASEANFDNFANSFKLN